MKHIIFYLREAALGHPDPDLKSEISIVCFNMASLKNSCHGYRVETSTLGGLSGPSPSPDITKAMVKDLLAEDSKIRSAPRAGTAIL